MLVAPHIPPNHGTVLVACDEMRYVVDASMLHGEPLRLDPDTPTGVTHPAWGAMQHTRWLLVYSLAPCAYARWA